MDRHQQKLLIEARDGLNGPEFQEHRDLLLNLALGFEITASEVEARFVPRIEEAPVVSSALAQESTGITFPLRVFLDRAGARHEGELLDRAGRMWVNGRTFPAPSPAAVAVTRGIAEPGWDVWFYRDPATGRELPIDTLRPPGMKQRRSRGRRSH